jgi:hypothetical protein
MRSLCICWIGLTLAASATAEPPPVPPVEVDVDHRVQRLFEQLDAEEFAVRKQAEQQLHDLGPAAIPALENAAPTAGSEVLPTILGLLERMLIEDSPDIADAAERALERLAFSEHPLVMHRARAVLSGNQYIRMRRAVAAIRELGGRVVFMPIDDVARGNVMWGWGGNQPSWIPGLPLATIHIWLLDTWQGGEEGLWHLTRLEDAWSARLWRIEVTNVRGSGIKQETVQTLAARLPHLSVSERGASLGIVTQMPNGKCIISDILPGGAAANAGLELGDVIEQLDDSEITDFAELVGKLLSYAPGEKVTLKIRRGGLEQDVPVTLGGWHDVNVAGRMGSQRPPPLVPPPLLPDLDQK